MSEPGAGAERDSAIRHSRPEGGEQPFPVVGIGASAGGLEALEEFFRNVPAASGMAFVVVQHLDPTHKGMLPDLLQRVTPLKVAVASDGLPVRPDHVYVIPPNRDLTILHGTLHLLEPAAPRGHRLPIDFFLTTLAEDRGALAIGVILSGMGSDGTQGMRAIRERAGLLAAQDPASAAFDSMPGSVIDTGLVDIVASAAELPARIIGFVRRPSDMAETGEAQLPDSSSDGLAKIATLLRTRTGNDFSLYKSNTLCRRIDRRMALHRIASIEDYLRFLRMNDGELDLLFKELLIGVTQFFRDPALWESLCQEILPRLLTECPANAVLRAWVVGCSTGEEAYSLAMVFKETQERLRPHDPISLQIFATDLDKDSIDRARQGWYPVNIASSVSPDRLERFFIEESGGYRVVRSLREMVVFAPQNVISDAPFTRLDVLVCRNLLIYFKKELQHKMLPLFHYSLRPGGLLILGNAESVDGFSALFTGIGEQGHVYLRTDAKPDARDMEFSAVPVAGRLPIRTPDPPSPEPVNLQLLTEQVVLSQFAPAAVLVNHEGDVLNISGRTGKYLEPAAGKANWNIFAMARKGIRAELSIALPMALLDMQTIVRRGVKVWNDAGIQGVDITLHPFDEPPALHGLALIVFADVPMEPDEEPQTESGGGDQHRAHELEHALRQAQEENRTIREQMQASQEEYQSANEELLSAIEELQSTNEELTTSKEEMQSLNEELQTVNAELQSKVSELSVANNDMKNLLNSTDIATVFLTTEMNVRRFTKQATSIFKLIPGDSGRPLSDIVTVLRYPLILTDARTVLRTLVACEEEVETEDGRWFLTRIMPYRTVDDVIDGVVLTFIDITEAKILEAKLRSLGRTSTPGADDSG